VANLLREDLVGCSTAGDGIVVLTGEAEVSASEARLLGLLDRAGTVTGKALV
jgi:hypothetical protein